jgi:hypothetical protein
VTPIYFAFRPLIHIEILDQKAGSGISFFNPYLSIYASYQHV